VGGIDARESEDNGAVIEADVPKTRKVLLKCFLLEKRIQNRTEIKSTPKLILIPASTFY
jgi:hypothetical protein